MNLRNLATVPLFILAVYLIFHLSRSIWATYRRTDRLAELRQEITQLEKEKERLLRQREYRQTEAYVEEEARNRLNMVKEGERIVILPETPNDADNGADRRREPGAGSKANWEKGRRFAPSIPTSVRKWVDYWFY